jgi:predicted  nucleic acid-binding Zn-ribbon protein
VNGTQVAIQVAQIRARASRARRLASSFVNDEERNRLLGYADTLEQEASELEKQIAFPVPSAPGTQVQVQVQQQQQQAEPPKASDKEGEKPKS